MACRWIRQGCIISLVLLHHLFGAVLVPCSAATKEMASGTQPKRWHVGGAERVDDLFGCAWIRTPSAPPRHSQSGHTSSHEINQAGMLMRSARGRGEGRRRQETRGGETRRETMRMRGGEQGDRALGPKRCLTPSNPPTSHLFGCALW